MSEINVCKKCGSENLLTRPKGVHIELYCGDCGEYQKFVKQSQETGEIASDKQQAYAEALYANWKKSGKKMLLSQAGAIIKAFKQ